MSQDYYSTPIIAAAVPHDDFTLTLTFVTGEQRLIGMKPCPNAPAFRPLRDPTLFKQARMDITGSLEWPAECDLAYDMLYPATVPLAVQTAAADI